MFQIADLQKIRTYYNKFITNAKRSLLDLKIELVDNNLVHTIAFGNMAIKATLKGKETNDFAPQVVNFGEWHASLDAKDEFGIKLFDVDVDLVNHISSDGINISKVIIGPTKLSSKPANSGSSTWNSIAILSSELLCNSVVINNVCAKKGLLNCNSSTFFRIMNNKCYIINTNDVLLHENVFDSDGGDYLFGIPNEFIGNLKKWLLFANKDNDDIELSICQMGTFNFLKMEFVSENNISYETIIPIEMNEKCTKSFNVLHNIINTSTWSKTEFSFDENDMYAECVNDGFSMLVKSDKKYSKKEIKKLFTDFQQEPDKAIAFRKKKYKDLIDLIDTTFLNVSKSVGEENLYILRTLYSDYISAISDFDYKAYFLDTEAKAVLMEHEDDFFSFKSLFMLRKPKEIIMDISDQDIDDEEDEIEINYDFFEPT